MNRNTYAKQRISSLFVVVMLIVFFIWDVNAQLGGGTQLGGSGCSTKSTDKFRQGTTVYYSLSGFNSTQQQQILAAIAQWNSANASNNSRVTFAPSDATHPANYTFQAGTTTSTGNSGSFAYTTWQTVSNTDRTVISATTTFYLNETFSDGTPVYDSGAGSDTIYLKVGLHEIGHPMGLEHPTPPKGQPVNYCAQTDGATVMNGFCGTNDNTNNAPTSIPQCDKDNIDSSYPTPSPSPTTSPTPPECPCGDCENGCCGTNRGIQDESGTDGCGECPCGDCIYGCNGGEECGWEEVEGQCYGGVAYGSCWDSYGGFNPNQNGCQYDPPYCDPPQTVWVCQ